MALRFYMIWCPCSDLLLSGKSAPATLKCAPVSHVGMRRRLCLQYSSVKYSHGSLYSFIQVSAKNSCLWRHYLIYNSTICTFSITLFIISIICIIKLDCTIGALVNCLYLPLKENLLRSRNLARLLTSLLISLLTDTNQLI